MLIAMLKTKPLVGERGFGDHEVGQFELPVNLDERLLEQSLEERKLVLRTVSEHLTSAIADTKVASNMWLVHFTPQMQREFSLAAVLDMDIGQ